MAENLYAVWKNEDGSMFYNPNCYATKYEVGSMVNDAKCVHVGTITECVKFVEQNGVKTDWTLSDFLK